MNPNPDLSNNIGELKGLLIGIQSMMAQQYESLNRRIDDTHHSTTRRLDDFTASINTRMSAHEANIESVERKADEALALAKKLEGSFEEMSRRGAKAGALTGGGTAALIAGGIELAKALVHS